MLRTRVRAGAAAGLVLSFVFATLFAAIGLFELYVPGLAPRFGETTPVTLRVPYGARLVQTDGDNAITYEHVRVIVPRGTKLVDFDEHGRPNREHRAAVAYESIRRPPSSARIGALWVIYFFVSMMLTAYLRRFGENRVRLLRAQVGLFVLMTGSIAIAKLLLLFTGLPEFWIPMAALPLWVALAFDRRTAFLLEVGVAFVAASLLRFDLILFAVFLVRGIAATLFFFDRKHPKQMVVAGVLSGVAGAIAYAALTILFEGGSSHLGNVFDVGRGLGSNILACLGGGVLAGLWARGLREPAERIMGHVSRDKLLDLTDLEQPLLKKMAAEAPGSWEHARAMANLAEATASAIGADALLTRVGAYYHDLGKTVQPKYFVENLAHGEPSPHAELEPEVSADAIMAHVVYGTNILREARIPEPVVEFAYTHHGTQLVEFFWLKCLENGNPKELTEGHFRYPGMKPQTKETAILMLVDSIEAASRTIWPPEREKFEEMIRRIVFTKLSTGQLDESGLSIEDLRIMVSRMASTLVNMYHGRIKYPWQRDGATGDRPTAAGATPAPPTTSVTTTPETTSSAPPTEAVATTPTGTLPRGPSDVTPAPPTGDGGSAKELTASNPIAHRASDPVGGRDTMTSAPRESDHAEPRDSTIATRNTLPAGIVPTDPPKVSVRPPDEPRAHDESD